MQLIQGSDRTVQEETKLEWKKRNGVESVEHKVRGGAPRGQTTESSPASWIFFLVEGNHLSVIRR